MATFFTYGEGADDATVQGAEWLQHILSAQHGPEAERIFAEKFQTLHKELNEKHNYDNGPLFDLFVEHGEDVFAAITDGPRAEERSKEVESFFALVLSMHLMDEEHEHFNEASTRLCDLFSSDHQKHTDLRLRLLMMLYNTYNNPTFEFRYRVFKSIVDYAAKAQLFDQVLPYLQYLDEWMADWDTYLKVDDKRELYRDLSRYMRALGKRVEAYQYLKKYHQLFQGEGKEQLATTQEATIELLKDAVQLPAVIQFDDVLAFDTVKALKKSKGPGPDLVELCAVFLNKSVGDLRAFHDGHKKLFEEHGLSFQDAVSKIRLLTLATLAQDRSEIDLSEVAQVLEESEDKVEPWVVRAISEGVVDGRIDQLRRKVLVKSSFQRTFGEKEWTFLDSKLTQWIDNLENVIQFIGDQKEKRNELTTIA